MIGNPPVLLGATTNTSTPPSRGPARNSSTAPGVPTGVTDTGVLAVPGPKSLTARIDTSNSSPEGNSVMIAGDPVTGGTNAVQVAPPSKVYSYPVIGEPLSSAAVNDNATEPGPALATTSVGANGGPAGVTDTEVDCCPSPRALIGIKKIV